MNYIKEMFVINDRFWKECLTNHLSRESDFVIVGTATTKEDALHLARLSDASIVLMELSALEKRRESLETIRDLREMRDIKIILLADDADDETISETLFAGAVNLLNKTHYEDISCVIRAAHHQIAFIHPDTAVVVLNEFRRLKREQRRKLLHLLKWMCCIYFNWDMRPCAFRESCIQRKAP